MNPRKTAVAAALAALLLAGPGVAQATPPAAPAPQEQVAAATITWTLERASNPTADQQAAYTLITSAMNAAVARYNNLSDLGKSITVRYDTSVPTADGNLNGTIRFGSNRSYMTERTALHEIAHTIGVGTSSGWSTRWQWHLDGCSGARSRPAVRRFLGQVVHRRRALLAVRPQLRERVLRHGGRPPRADRRRDGA